MVKACQIPLQDFIDKISKFEGSLGAWNAKEKTPSGFGRWVQWSECGLQSRHPGIEVYTRKPYSFYHSASKYPVADSLRLLSWLAPAYVISLNVSSETSLTAENERTKNFKKVEAQMKAKRALREGFTGQQSRAPTVDTDDKAALEALDNKVDNALSYSVVIDTKMEQQTDLFRTIEREIASLKLQFTPNSQLALLTTTSANDASSKEAISPLSTALKVLEIALTVPSAALSNNLTFRPLEMLSRP